MDRTIKPDIVLLTLAIFFTRFSGTSSENLINRIWCVTHELAVRAGDYCTLRTANRYGNGVK